MYPYITAVTLCLLFCASYSVASFVSDQFSMVDEETKLIDILGQIVELERSRLGELDHYKDTLIQSVESYSSAEEFVSNPLAIFKTVKHLTEEFEKSKQTMIKNCYNDSMTKFLEEENILLSDEDFLYSEIRSLIQMKRVHNLSVTEIIAGKLGPNKRFDPALTPDDCFYIGRISAKKFDHETAIEWLQACEKEFNDVTKTRACKILISSSLFTGDFQLSRAAINKYEQNITAYRKLPDDLKVNVNQKLNHWPHIAEFNQWESTKTCAGIYDDEMRVQCKLRCRYNHHNSPFLTIAPLKEEMLSLTPKVSIFREAVHDSEIELFKTSAYNKLKSAETGIPDEPDLYYRTSQTASLNNREFKFKNLWNRLMDISSLSLEVSEGFQVLHYGPGGFYRLHGDYILPTEEQVRVYGNRIATALMYLNNVISGGNTVFPRIKLNVQPVKGSILFWINMRLDGSQELLTKHAACPVIYGEKFACTQWFRMGGQDHWIAEPKDDVNADYSMNPNFVCQKRIQMNNTLFH